MGLSEIVEMTIFLNENVRLLWVGTGPNTMLVAREPKGWPTRAITVSCRMEFRSYAGAARRRHVCQLRTQVEWLGDHSFHASQNGNNFVVLAKLYCRCKDLIVCEYLNSQRPRVPNRLYS